MLMDATHIQHHCGILISRCHKKNGVCPFSKIQCLGVAVTAIGSGVIFQILIRNLRKALRIFGKTAPLAKSLSKLRQLPSTFL